MKYALALLAGLGLLLVAVDGCREPADAKAFKPKVGVVVGVQGGFDPVATLSISPTALKVGGTCNITIALSVPGTETASALGCACTMVIDPRLSVTGVTGPGSGGSIANTVTLTYQDAVGGQHTQNSNTVVITLWNLSGVVLPNRPDGSGTLAIPVGTLDPGDTATIVVTAKRVR